MAKGKKKKKKSANAPRAQVDHLPWKEKGVKILGRGGRVE